MASMQKLIGPGGATLEVVDTAGVASIELDGVALVGSPEVVTATNTLTAAESGKTIVLNSATSIITTLPAVALGLNFKFWVGPLGVANGQNHTIVVPAANDNTIFGGAIVAGVEVPASAEGSINIVGTSGTTALPGDYVEVFCDGTNWNVNGRGTTAGSITFTT